MPSFLSFLILHVSLKLFPAYFLLNCQFQQFFVHRVQWLAQYGSHVRYAMYTSDIMSCDVITRPGCLTLQYMTILGLCLVIGFILRVRR